MQIGHDVGVGKKVKAGGQDTDNSKILAVEDHGFSDGMGSPLKSSFQRRSLIKAAGAAFAASSDGAISRPIKGLTPSVMSKEQDARNPAKCSAFPGEVRSKW